MDESGCTKSSAASFEPLKMLMIIRSHYNNSESDCQGQPRTSVFVLVFCRSNDPLVVKRPYHKFPLSVKPSRENHRAITRPLIHKSGKFTLPPPGPFIPTSFSPPESKSSIAQQVRALWGVVEAVKERK